MKSGTTALQHERFKNMFVPKKKTLSTKRRSLKASNHSFKKNKVSIFPNFCMQRYLKQTQRIRKNPALNARQISRKLRHIYKNTRTLANNEEHTTKQKQWQT